MQPQKNRSILVADDSASMRSALARFLRQAGYARVTTASDGQEALSNLSTRPYDIVVSDWNMPRLNGLELLKQIRADERHNGLPFLMVTVRQSREDIMQAIEAGVSDYIVKPFTAKILVEKVDRLLREAAPGVLEKS